MARKVTPPSCTFCGAQRAVRSRVLPAWLDALFPDHPPLAAQRTIACKQCTRGWLATIEADARPLVERLTTGDPHLLGQEDQRALALWGTKTILLLQAIRDPELVPPGAFWRMHQERRPPAGLRVAVALRAPEGRWPYRFAAQGSGVDYYRAELCVGGLVIRVAANFAAQVRPIDLGSAAVEIWPAVAPVEFPPAHGIVRASRAA